MITKRFFFSSILIAATFLLIGCSGGGTNSIVQPEHPVEIVAVSGSHSTWGLWQFIADPDEGKLDVVQLREGNFHLNALVFLEPPPFTNLTLESLEFNGNIIEADIGLRHPFLGLDKFTGFDVCGVLISSGSVTGFTDTDLRMAGEGETRLLNPDGLTRWWNPAEFPSNGTMFGYEDGLLGAPDSFADFNCTLNGYKYYTDDLVDPDAPLSDVTLESRGKFSAGQKNVRHFTIELGTEGFVFNYAVDASWQFPLGSPPYSVPDDFAAGANKTEAWRADITNVSNSLYNDGVTSGGSLSFDINLYDWFNAELNTVYIESPGNFPAVGPLGAVSGGEGYSTYEVDITGATPQAQGSIDVLIIAECEAGGYGGLLPGKTEAAYFLYKPTVSGGGGLVCDIQVITPMPYSGWAGPIEFDASGSSGPGTLSFEWDFNDDGIFGDVYDFGTDENPRKCFDTNYVGDVCVRVSNGTAQVECCESVNITILPSKNIQLRNVEAYDFAIDPMDGDLLVLYEDGLIYKYEIDDWYQEGSGTEFIDLDDQWYQDANGLDYIDITANGALVVTGKDTPGLNRSCVFYADGSSIGSTYFHGSTRTIFDACAYGSEDEHANNLASISGRYADYNNRFYSEVEWFELPNYNATHWFSYSFLDTGDYSGIDKIYHPYSIAVETDKTGDYVWWLESAATEYYCTRWHCVTGSNPTYSDLIYDNAYFGTGSQTNNDECWYDAKDICRDDENRYFVLDLLSTNIPRIKVFDITSSPGTGVGGFGDGTSISGTPLRIEGSDYAGYIVVMHGASAPQMISIFTECEIPE